MPGYPYPPDKPRDEDGEHNYYYGVGKPYTCIQCGGNFTGAHYCTATPKLED